MIRFETRLDAPEESVAWRARQASLALIRLKQIVPGAPEGEVRALLDTVHIHLVRIEVDARRLSADAQRLYTSLEAMSQDELKCEQARLQALPEKTPDGMTDDLRSLGLLFCGTLIEGQANNRT